MTLTEASARARVARTDARLEELVFLRSQGVSAGSALSAVGWSWMAAERAAYRRGMHELACWVRTV